MKLPPGCGTMSGKVVRLNKSLNGLKQASRTFYERLVSDLKTIGFDQSLSDPCVLRFMMGDEVMGMVAITWMTFYTQEVRVLPTWLWKH